MGLNILFSKSKAYCSCCSCCVFMIRLTALIYCIIARWNLTRRGGVVGRFDPLLKCSFTTKGEPMDVAYPFFKRHNDLLE